MFQPFLGLLECLVVLHEVQMGQHTHDAGETVHLNNVQELKCFHFKAEACINEQQNLQRSIQSET